MFGISYYIANILMSKMSGPVVPIYLLLALHFLKNYCTECVMHNIFDLDKKTIRKWTRIYVKRISNIKVICLSDRYVHALRGRKILVTVDGIDCPFHEPCRPVDPAYLSHKLKRAGLRYEVGVSIYSPRICWVAGGVPCGANPDLRIAREEEGLIDRLVQNEEQAAADNGYDGEESLVTPIRDSELSDVEKRYNRWIRRLLARHENVNKRLKDFKILTTIFRHSENYHNTCFMACAVLTQLSMQVEPIHDINLAL